MVQNKEMMNKCCLSTSTAMDFHSRHRDSDRRELPVGRSCGPGGTPGNCGDLPIGKLNSAFVREQFSFTLPDQVLRTVKILCCDGYGASLWLLESAHASSYFKARSSCVRRVFRLPLTTHTYLVEGHLACEFTPLRNVLLGNFVSFFQRAWVHRWVVAWVFY